MRYFLSALAAGCGQCVRNVLQDEQGNWSSARCLLWLVVVYTLVELHLVAHQGLRVDNAAYGLLGGLLTGLLAWAGGPRIAQYLGPQVGAVVQALGQAARDPRPPGAPKAYDVDLPRAA